MNKQDDTQVEHDERLTRRARQLFDESVDGLDGQALSRLNRGRHAALEAAQSAPGFRPFSPWVPAAGVAAAAVFAVVLWNGQVVDEPLAPTSAATDIEILLNEESFEMLDELEFYSWIDLDAEIEVETEEGSNVG